MFINAKIRLFFLVLALAAVFSACESSMGMGPTVDLEPPTLKITGIVLPDGTEIPILEDENKMFVGPGILVGPGFCLKGVAWDNEKVTEITVEETGSGAEIVNGKPRKWTDAVIGPQRSVPGVWGGEHEWTISLDGISPGERNILVTAYDLPGNIGPNSVKQLTLLVDLDPPFVDKITIERQPGITVGLLPKSRLEEMDPDLFENLDYFQNESFTIRASISHNFSLSGVTLNFIDEDGNTLFQNGLERTAGSTVYAPSWHITGELLAAANPVYLSGRRYLKVIITARAEAGHSGQNEDKSNLLFNLCWYPEADVPKIQMAVSSSGVNEAYRFDKSSRIPLNVFDDDNVGEIYAAMVSALDWENFMPGSGDDVKINELIKDKSVFPHLNENKLTVIERNATIPVEAGETRGDFRLVVLARDVKDNAPGVWAGRIFNINVVEEGIPIITVKGPATNESPQLTNGRNFTIFGNIQNLDNLEKIKIAWIPAGTGWDAVKTNTEAEKALSGSAAGALDNGVKIWELPLAPGKDEQLGSRWYKVQDFSVTFNILDDFIYNGNLENETKLFFIYARGKAGDEVFESLRYLPYKKPPVLKVYPLNWDIFSPNADINFIIEAYSESGVQIENNAVKLFSNKDNVSLSLAREGNIWKTTTSKDINGEYGYQITATDRLGNMAQQDITLVINSPPELSHVTSPHNAGEVFSGRDTITIQAFFDGTVDNVRDASGNEPVAGAVNVPRLKLEGFEPSTTVRYAYYVSGEKTTTLEFEYKVESGDYINKSAAPPPGLKVTALELNGGRITAKLDGISGDGVLNLSAAKTMPNQKAIYVDGRAPTILNIALTGKDGDTAYTNWFRAGATVEARVTASREIRVLGTPSLILQFDGTNNTRTAGFIKTESDNKTMVFEYKINSGDNAVPVRYTLANCFSVPDRQTITDTVGSNGNYMSLTGLSTSVTSSAVNVDAVAPAALNVDYTSGGDTPASKTLQISGTFDTTQPAAKVEYTTDGGLTWTTVANPSTPLPAITGVGSYNVFARQTDRAGNVSPNGTNKTFTISDCELIAISCDNPDGAYTTNSKLTFKLIFSGKVTNQATGTTITIQGTGASGADTNQGEAETITFPVNSAANNYVLTYEWPVAAGKIWNPVTITAVNLGGVRGEGNTSPTVNAAAVMSAYNSSRAGIRVLSVRPTITQLNGAAPAGSNTSTVLASANSTVTLKFSRNVSPEKGKITIKPSAGWHIPPVLSNDDYYKVSSAVSGDNLTYLTNNYTKTTHGLLKTGASYNGTPDTETKYVLNFGLNISDTTGAVNNVRGALEAAKYLWQEIESVSASQVTVLGDTVTLKLDTLPNGRLWKIEIDEGAFLDEAGNTFAGWNSLSDYRFWSAKTADPVIRVNRVSNNSATVNPTTNTVSGTMGTVNEVTSRVNVEYRIDCETPGAVIRYNTWNRGAPPSLATDANTRGVDYGVATIDTTMPKTGTASLIYRAYPQKGDWKHNSNITDATVAELNSMMTTEGVTGTGTSVAVFSTVQTIGDDSLYTARKDYIAAIAKRDTAPALAISDRSYEGAFKTVLVFRNPHTRYATNGTVSGTVIDPPYIKVEGTNIQNGAVTVSGFPLNVNDVTGKSSKYFYQSGTGNVDRIWISWEVVCDYWQVFMGMPTAIPNSPLITTGTNSWDYWPEMWYRWIYRKYGNWGLMDGHMSAYNPDYEQNYPISGYPGPTAP